MTTKHPSELKRGDRIRIATVGGPGWSGEIVTYEPAVEVVDAFTAVVVRFADGSLVPLDPHLMVEVAGVPTPGCLTCGLLAARGAELPCGDCR